MPKWLGSLYAYILICLYAYMPICLLPLYAYMPICLYAYMPICLYAYRLNRRSNNYCYEASASCPATTAAAAAGAAVRRTGARALPAGGRGAGKGLIFPTSVDNL